MSRMRWTSLALGALLLAGDGCAPPVPVPLTPSPPPEDEGAAGQLAPSGTRWSVRIHTDEDPTRAQEVASEAEPRFDVPVSLVRIGGATHVQVGSFATEAQARELLSVARARGYRSAAVVHTTGDSLPNGP